MSARRLTDEQERAIYAAWDNGFGKSIRGLARDHDVAFDTAKAAIKRQRKAQGLSEKPASFSDKQLDTPALEVVSTQPVTPEADPVEAERQRIDRTRTLRAEKEALHAVAGEKSFRAFLESLVRDVADRLPPPPPYRPARPQGARETVETLYLAFSDWHAYEAVQPQRVMGLNRYDAGVFGRRVHRVVETATDIKSRMERGDWRFPRLVVGVNGDMLSGTIHEVERHSDAPNIVAAAFGCGRVLAEALRDLSAHFESVDVVCTSGNHGRLPDARKVQSKDPTRSWDTMVAYIAATALEHHRNVRFHIPDSYHAIVEIEGWNVYQYHGHGIKSQLSIPFYGLKRHTAGTTAISGKAGRQVHYHVFGHFHSASSMPTPRGELFINGSLIGGTEYGVDCYGSVDVPQQLMLAFHPEHGVTHRWPILAGDGLSGAGYDVQAWERFT